MRPSLAIRAVLAALVFAPLVAAQPNPGTSTLKLFDQFTVSAWPRWHAGNQTRTSLEISVPAQQQRDSAGADQDKNPKPRRILGGEAGMLITLETRRSHEEAVRRLADIAAEQAEPVTKLVIDGWPAIERRYRALMPQPGDDDGSGSVTTWFLTTAVASGATVVRFETTLAPGADLKLLDEALAMGRALRGPKGNADLAQKELDQLARVAAPPAPEAPPPSAFVPKPPPGGATAGTAVQARTGLGELEVAASTNGANVLVATNTGFSFSSNFGASWTSGGGTPCNQAACDGDPSLAVGQSGAFYYAWIGGASGSALGDGLSRSTNNGQTFSFQALAVTCPGASSCQVADQEHIAADRNNAGSGGDRLYNVWRNFTSSAFSIRIVCSSNSGVTWGAQQVIGSGDLPRVSVGGDGFVYVGWASGGNLMLNKYSNCDAGLVQQAGFPVVVAAFVNVVCPVPGLDRCNGRNILSSQTIAVDDLDPNHVYYTYATSTGPGNEDILVRDSVDGGATFPRSVRVNAAVTGRRFMPWVSVYGGVAAVSWYDRRSATAATNDDTRFFVGTAKLNGSSLVALTEVDLSGNNDHQCSLWPCATNATSDAESCSVQPQLAGRCSISGAPCDFSSGSPPCPGTQTCNIGRGCPKYGDYNGNAARAGRQYSAWASAVPPVGVVGAPAGINVYTSVDRVPSDFFVRDWTVGTTNHDDGTQPSTNPTFWTTSDVWNQNVMAPEPFVNDWVLGDAPSRTGTNFAFARVSRRAAAASTAPAANVTVHFSFADFGAGLNYGTIGSEVVTFAAGDLSKLTPGHAWAIPASASYHLCLVAEIDGPDGDLLAPPSVVGLSPGAGIALITTDNNKAQRNLQETVGAAGGTEMFAIVRNDQRIKRAMQMAITTRGEGALAGVVTVVGGRPVALQRETRVDVGVLAPGETRWLQFRATSMPPLGRPVTVDFADADAAGGGGFSIQVTRAPIEVVAPRNFLAFTDVLTRTAALENSALAKREAAAARGLSANGNRITPARYVSYLAAHRSAIKALVVAHLGAAKGADPFDLAGAVKALDRALGNGRSDAVAAAQNALTERLDAHLTMQVRAKDS